MRPYPGRARSSDRIVTWPVRPVTIRTSRGVPPPGTMKSVTVVVPELVLHQVSRTIESPTYRRQDPGTVSPSR